MNILAIDYGEKNIGLAIAGGGVKIAAPLKVIDNTQNLFDDLASIVEEEKIDLILLGLPRGLDGQETQQTQIIRQFKDDLNVKLEGVEVKFQDEAGTSSQVMQGGVADKMIDARAAALFLQDYLEEN